MKRKADLDVIREPSPVRTLFVTFLSIGVSGFGGVLPWARRALVDRKKWMSPEDFNETLALCQSLPGPNVVNLAVVVGARSAGAKGAVSALLGLVGAPVAIVLVLATLYARFGESGRIPGAITALGAAAAGLVWATAARMAQPLLARRPASCAATIGLAFVSVVWLRLPLPGVLLGLTPIGMMVVWLARDAGRAP